MPEPIGFFVYMNRTNDKNNIDDLNGKWMKIISSEVIENVKWETLYRIHKCLEVSGQYIEHQ